MTDGVRTSQKNIGHVIERCDKFDSVSKGCRTYRTLGGSQRAICPGIYCVCHTSSIIVYLGKLYPPCEEHWVFFVIPWHMRGRRALGLRPHRAAAGDVVVAGSRVGGMSSWCCAMLGFSVIDNMPRVLSFFLVPFVDIFRSNRPRVLDLQISTLSSLNLFIFHKLVQFISPSLGWSSCFSWRSRRHDKSRIPLSGFSGPHVWPLGGDPEGLSPFQFLLCFDTICDVVCQHFSSASLALLFLSVQSSNSSSWLDVLSASSSNEILAKLYVSQRVARIVLVIQSSPYFSLGVTHNYETLSALFHERNQITMKLNVEICHVSPILPRSNLLDVRLGNRLIVSVLSPIQLLHLGASTRNLYLQSGQVFSSPLKPFILENAFVRKSRASYVVLATCAAPRLVRVSN